MSRRGERVKNPLLMSVANFGHVRRVQVARMEDDGMTQSQQRTIIGQNAVVTRTAGIDEGTRAQSEIEIGTIVIFRPEEDDFLRVATSI